jgi:hypothetical protein
MSACTPNGAGWGRPHTTDTERGADYDACSAEVRAETRVSRGIDADVLASRSQDYERAGLNQSFVNTVEGGEAETESRLLADCMALKGYSRP